MANLIYNYIDAITPIYLQLKCVSNSINSLINGIQILSSAAFQELMLNENPSMLTVLDYGLNNSSPQGDILLCVGYKNHWDIVNGRTGVARNLHTVEGAKVNLVAALDLYEDQEVQLLLCYNRKLPLCFELLFVVVIFFGSFWLKRKRNAVSHPVNAAKISQKRLSFNLVFTQNFTTPVGY